MPTNSYIKSTVIIFALLSMFCLEAKAVDLQLRIKNIKNRNGYLLILLFDNATGFPNQSKLALRKYRLKLENFSGIFKIDSVQSNKYSISVVHDENSNNELDTNILGIPKEGIGFSNNPTILFSSPKFEECRFEAIKNQTNIEIKLKYF